LNNKDVKPLTRAEITEHVRQRLRISAREADDILNSALDLVAEILEADGQIAIKNLGRFQVKPTPARPGRNPKTGSAVNVPARLRPTFAMSRTLRDHMAVCWGDVAANAADDASDGDAWRAETAASWAEGGAGGGEDDGQDDADL
jgi:integration host factor subunit alpha